MWLKRHKWKCIGALAVAAILFAAFLLGGNAPATDTQTEENPASSETAVEEMAAENATPGLPETSAQMPSASPAESSQPAETEPAESGEPDVSTSPAESPEPRENNSPSGAVSPSPSETGSPSKPPETSTEPETSGLSCTLSISCSTILNNMDMLDSAKTQLVPADGWILAPVTVSFTEGETVFDVLQRTVREKSIHMESEMTPLYGSVYVEGIGNLYEFDCGSQSGWMYKVNGWFPNYGCSKYILSDGDIIQWVYTCDLGYDVGGGYAVEG